jgi:hypothetical protein
MISCHGSSIVQCVTSSSKKKKPHNFMEIQGLCNIVTNLFLKWKKSRYSQKVVTEQLHVIEF